MDIDKDTQTRIKIAMGYRDVEQCCKTCASFVPTDCSGSSHAKDAHCTLSPAFDLPVDEAGCCWHYNRRMSKPHDTTRSPQ